jgi:hypothetical protein
VRKLISEQPINNTVSSNFDKILDKFESNLPELLKNRIPIIKKFVIDYIRKSGYKIKFLNACPSYSGVRTKDQIIICAPNYMATLGDFLYTIFHEIRHEQQISEIKMLNPLSEFDLEDFESIYNQYWEMELDADTFAKNMVGLIVQKCKIPMDIAKENFKLSEFIKNYPQASMFIKNNLRGIIHSIKDMKSKGIDYEDIQDHPLVKPYIDRLENFI